VTEIRRLGSAVPLAVAGPSFRDLVAAWEDAYRSYTSAWQLVQLNGFASDEDAEHTAGTAYAVAETWQELAKWRGLPWWTVAALESAAEGFRDVSEDWRNLAGGVVATPEFRRVPSPIQRGRGRSGGRE
jgi:hypothetical protein